MRENRLHCNTVGPASGRVAAWHAGCMADGRSLSALSDTMEGRALSATTKSSRKARFAPRSPALRLAAPALVFAALGLSVGAEPARAAPVAGAWQVCASLIEAAEQALELPPHLLQAISKVESGRWNQDARAKIAWPWTVMAEGRGRYLPSKAAAIKEVETLQARGVRNIDVGCTQVNLKYHGDAFDNLHQALDPVHNVAYAAVFLSQLRSDSSSWTTAVGRYHSRTPKLSGRYRTKVFRAWRQEKKQAYRRDLEARERERSASVGAIPGVSAVMVEAEPRTGELLAEAADKARPQAKPESRAEPAAAAKPRKAKNPSRVEERGIAVAAQAPARRPGTRAAKPILLAQLTGPRKSEARAVSSEKAPQAAAAPPPAPEARESDASPGGVTLADLFSKSR